MFYWGKKTDPLGFDVEVVWVDIPYHKSHNDFSHLQFHPNIAIIIERKYTISVKFKDGLFRLKFSVFWP